MKRIIFAYLLVCFLFNACRQKENKANQNEASTEAVSDKPTSAPTAYDFDKIPISKKDIGKFPYLPLPKGYEYKYEKKKEFELKYFFYNDSLVTAKDGSYFFSTIWKKENNASDYEKTFVLKSYVEAITNLGGFEIFSGTLPENGKTLIYKNKPSYFDDLSQNYAATYKQYLLKTPHKNLWFELFIVDNEQEIRLSILEEKVLN